MQTKTFLFTLLSLSLSTGVALAHPSARRAPTPAPRPMVLDEAVVVTDASAPARRLAADLQATRRRATLDRATATRAEAAIGADRAALAAIDRKLAQADQAYQRAVAHHRASAAGDAGRQRGALVLERDAIRARLNAAEAHRLAALHDRGAAMARVARLDRQATAVMDHDLATAAAML